MSTGNVFDVCGGDGSFGFYCMEELPLKVTTFDRIAHCSISTSSGQIIIGDVFNYDFSLLGDHFDVVTINNSWQLFSDHQWFRSLVTNLRPKYVFITCPTEETLADLRRLGYLDNCDGSDFSSAVSNLQELEYKLINSGFCGRSNFVITRWLFIKHIIMFRLFGFIKSEGNFYRYGLFEFETL